MNSVCPSMTKTILPGLLFSLCILTATAQEYPLTLDECRRAAVEHSPLTVRQRLAADKREAKDRATSAALIPQFEINAQASYQNQTVELPGELNLPFSIDLPLDQYRATVDFSQVIYGGNSVRNTKRVNAATEEVETLSLEVQLDRLRDQINEIYLNILLTNRQLDVNQLMRQTLAADMKAVSAQVKHGTTTGGTQAALAARMLELEQEKTSLQGTREKLLQTLRTLTGLSVTESTPLVLPEVPSEAPTTDNRPFQRTELKLYDSQREQLDMQNRLLNSRANPQLSLFASGGYGRPGYNPLESNFSLMAIGGVRFRLPLTAWDATQKEKQANRLLSRDIDQQQRDFERNTSIEIAQYATDIQNLQEIITLDPQIVVARTIIREQALAQLKGGVITESEYLTEFNNEATARIQAETNALLLIQAWIRYNAARGIYE